MAFVQLTETRQKHVGVVCAGVLSPLTVCAVIERGLVAFAGDNIQPNLSAATPVVPCICAEKTGTRCVSHTQLSAHDLSSFCSEPPLAHSAPFTKSENLQASTPLVVTASKTNIKLIVTKICKSVQTMSTKATQ